jgi:hypothetical protein
MNALAVEHAKLNVLTKRLAKARLFILSTLTNAPNVLVPPIRLNALIFVPLAPPNLTRTDRKAEKNCKPNTIDYIPENNISQIVIIIFYNRILINPVTIAK